MKTARCLIVFVFVLLVFTIGAYADTTGVAVDSSTVTQQPDEQKTREGITALMSFLDKYQGNDSLGVDSLQHKTWAGVLDKALDMFSGAVKKIVETIEKAAPHVWEIMVRQQYAKAFAGVAMPFGILIIIFLYYRFLSKKWTPASDDTFDEMVDSSDHGWGWGWRIFFGKFIPLVASSVTGIVLINAIQDAVLLVVNPYYYAIRDILIIFLGNGQGM